MWERPRAAQGQWPPYSIVMTHHKTQPSGPADLFTSFARLPPVGHSHSRFWAILPAREIPLNVTSAVREMGHGSRRVVATAYSGLANANQQVHAVISVAHTAHRTLLPHCSVTAQHSDILGFDAGSPVLRWAISSGHFTFESLSPFTDRMRVIIAASSS